MLEPEPELPAVKELRKAIMGYQFSQNELARKAKVDPGALSKFVNKKGDLTLVTAAKLFEALGLNLCPADATPSPKTRVLCESPGGFQLEADAVSERGAGAVFSESIGLRSDNQC
jgi:transcriptional regulator with XRE-family HTH domain